MRSLRRSVTSAGGSAVLRSLNSAPISPARLRTNSCPHAPVTYGRYLLINTCTCRQIIALPPELYGKPTVR